MPVSSCTTPRPASRSASARLRCSPCDACVRASRPSIVNCQSSRCGPTSVTPAVDLGPPARARARRASSSSTDVGVGDSERLRRRLRFVGLGDGPSVVGERRVRRVRPPGPAGRRAATAPEPARAAACTSCSSNTSSVATRRRVAHARSQQRVALFQHPLEVAAGRVVADGEHPEQLVEVQRGARPGRPSPDSRSSGANTVTRRSPCRSRARVTARLLHWTRLRPDGADLGLEELLAVVAHDLGAHDRLGRNPLRTSGASVDPAERVGPRDPRRSLRAGSSCPARSRRESP